MAHSAKRHRHAMKRKQRAQSGRPEPGKRHPPKRTAAFDKKASRGYDIWRADAEREIVSMKAKSDYL